MWNFTNIPLRSEKNTHILRINNSVTPLRSYTNSTITDLARNSTSRTNIGMPSANIAALSTNVATSSAYIAVRSINVAASSADIIASNGKSSSVP